MVVSREGSVGTILQLVLTDSCGDSNISDAELRYIVCVMLLVCVILAFYWVICHVTAVPRYVEALNECPCVCCTSGSFETPQKACLKDI